ncbi:MAG: signal peptidase I [Oscillospiraceae bacterium]|nr:signal peptidase I [Oscillospiraceae bacterium]
MPGLRGQTLLSEGEMDKLIDLLDACLGARAEPEAPWGLPAAPGPGKRPAGYARKATARKIISAVLFYGLLSMLVLGAFLISRGDKKPVFGYTFANVLTWSMQPEIPQGSLVIIKDVDPDTLEIGDDITYMQNAETSVTHRIIGITEDLGGTGQRGFETQGIDNDAPDFELVPAVNVVGKVVFHAPLLGEWLDILRRNLLLFAGFTAGLILLAVFLRGALKKGPNRFPGRPPVLPEERQSGESNEHISPAKQGKAQSKFQRKSQSKSQSKSQGKAKQ